MTPGRRPTPTHLKVVRDNPGHRPLNDNEPQPERVIPARPEWLTGVSARVWGEYADLLLKNGVLTELDGMAFALLCQNFARWAEAERELSKTSLVLLSPTGFPMPNPWLHVANGAMDNIRKYLIEFGMTPAARSKVQVAWANQKNNGRQGGFDF